MSKIAALIADLFEDAEYLQPTDEFRKNGHMVENIGLAGRKKVKGLASHAVFVHLGVRDVSSRNYDALFIPGGYSPDKLRANNNAVCLVREFMNREKPVFAICNGLQLLISACMLAGRKVAAQKSLAQDIANAGGIISDREVMVDGTLITCSSDEELPAFIITCLHKLSSEQ